MEFGSIVFSLIITHRAGDFYCNPYIELSLSGFHQWLKLWQYRTSPLPHIALLRKQHSCDARQNKNHYICDFRYYRWRGSQYVRTDDCSQYTFQFITHYLNTLYCPLQHLNKKTTNQTIYSLGKHYSDQNITVLSWRKDFTFLLIKQYSKLQNIKGREN